MEKRTQFTFYESVYVSLQKIRKKQDRADAYDAICAYALYQKEPDLEKLSDAAAIAFELIRPVLDSARRKAQNGKQGGSKRKQAGSKPESNASKKEAEEEGEKEIENEEEIENEIESECYARVREQTESTGFLFTLFWNAYPEQGSVDRERAWEAWKALNLDDGMAADILSCLEAWKKSRRWREDGGEYIPNAANFLTPGKGYIDRVPASYVPTGGEVKPSMTLGDAEMEAIARVLKQT